MKVKIKSRKFRGFAAGLFIAGLTLLGLFQNCAKPFAPTPAQTDAASQAPSPSATGIPTYGWLGTTWSACSSLCAGGVQTRNVTCVNDLSAAVDDSHCPLPKPATSQSCNTQACETYMWIQSGFSPCSVSCGGGTQSQTVLCKNSSAQTMTDSFCTSTKPATSQSCNPQACPICTAGTTQTCQASHGTGTQTCNGTGSAWGSCGNFTKCDSGYNLQNGTCAVNICTPNSTRSCQGSSSYQVCNSAGNTWGSCAGRLISSGFLGQNISTSFNQTSQDWTSSLVKKAVTELAPAHMRYPGGTDANYWNWSSGWFWPTYTHVSSTVSNPYHLNASLDAYAALAKGASSDTLFVLNVMTVTGKPVAPWVAGDDTLMWNDQVGMLNKAKSLGLTVKYVELGNEFSFGQMGSIGKDYVTRFPQAWNYINEMNSWISGIHQTFPGTKVAVVGDPITNSSDDREKNWNSQIYQYQIGADAITFHFYPGVPAYANQTHGEALGVAFSAWQNNRKLIQTATQKGLESWITEFDMGDTSSNGNYAGTWMSGLFVAEMVAQMLVEPGIAFATFYDLSSGNWNGNHTAYFTDSTAIGPSQTQSGTGGLSASGVALSVFAKALAGAKGVTSLNLSGGAKATPYSYPALDGVRIDADEKTRWVVINFSSQTQTLNLNNESALQVESTSVAKLETLVTVSRPAGKTTASVAAKGTISLPPYSINLIK